MKKRLLIISHDFVKKVNIRIYEELKKKIKIEILCIRPKKLVLNKKIIHTDFKKNNSNINIVEKNTIFNNLRFLYFNDIFKNIIKFKPTHIIVHSDPVSFQTISLIFFSLFQSFSVICVSNENKVLRSINNFKIIVFLRSSLLFFVNFFLKKRIKYILCITKQIKKNYDFLGYKNKTILMPLGFDQNIFKKKKFKRNKIFTISYFGRISPEKGIHILLKSLKNIKFKINLLLDISHVDDKEYFEQLKFKFKTVLKNSNTKMIKCDHFQIAKFMSKSDLVVLPSIYEEQYGRVIQEAIACGSLVIGSRVGAIPEIIKDKDLLFKKNNYNQLSDKINNLKNINFYKNKINKIYKMILKERSLNAQLNIIEKLF